MTAQSGSITGSVTDSNTNDPLPGVNVIVKNTTNGTNTDFNGNFSVDNVSAGDVLVFSYLGYKTYEYTVSNSFNVSSLVLISLINSPFSSKTIRSQTSVTS